MPEIGPAQGQLTCPPVTVSPESVTLAFVMSRTRDAPLASTTTWFAAPGPWTVMSVLSPSAPAVRVMCAGRMDWAKLIVSVPEPDVQFEPEGVASVLAESIAWRRVHCDAVPAGSALEVTVMAAALALALSERHAPATPIVARDRPSFLPTPRICNSSVSPLLPDRRRRIGPVAAVPPSSVL